jgi:CDP-glucose 4,6-dehydratase
VHFLVTGHTGFKGAWLSLLLASRGHQVSGLALDPEPGALFTRARVSEILEHDVRLDIRQADATAREIARIAPDVVIHMAAQPLVRASYADPRWTIETNVMGTLAVLEGVAASPGVRAAVMVTTDKVYRNVERIDGYVEDDALGGRDPYSASKAMADILVASWTSSFSTPPTAVARAGNVIGGGDVSVDRLMPDLIRAFTEASAAELRSPDAVRPWQHVLDCLAGYLLLVDALLVGGGHGAWNFGPDPASFRTVGETADLAAGLWGKQARWVRDASSHPHEAGLLTLDATRARSELGWTDVLDFSAAVGWTVDWARRVHAGEDPRAVCMEQISRFAGLGLHNQEEPHGH